MDERHYLSPLFEPQSVAVIGATERPGALGRVLVHNMLEAGFKGRLFAVNPKYKQVQGVPCVHRITDAAERVDLAVIATPAHTVPEIVAECGRAGVRAAVVLSAGFGETGAAGAALEARVLREAQRHGMRLLGPNSLGVLRPHIGLNATFAHGQAKAGSIGFISQSGALCAAILDYARPNQVGFSTVASLGVSSDLDFGEVLDYLVWDFRTEAILLYIEGIRDARRFLSALRAAARAKPVMVLKAGRHPLGLRAAQSHTASRTGDDGVFDAAFRRAGVIRLHSLSQLYAATKALFAHFRPRGNRLAIITNGGGPGVMAADRAGDLDIPLARLAPDTLQRLQKVLPPHSSLANPVDLIGDADPERYAAALAALLEDDEVDGVLCLLAPQAMTRPTEVAQRVVALSKTSDKPILTCWLGDEQCLPARDVFRQAGIPSVRTPEIAVDLFSHISAYYRNQQLLTQVPAPLEGEREPLIEAGRLIIQHALYERRTVLHRHEAMALLAAFHIRTVPMLIAQSAQEATELAASLGFPVVLQPNVPLRLLPGGRARSRLGILSNVGIELAFVELVEELRHRMPQALGAGVCVEPMVRADSTRELMLRVWRDPVFGPVIGFGERSLDPHYWPDRGIALPPLNAFLADDLVRNTRAAARMAPMDGMPAADIEAVEAMLLRISQIVCEMPWIRTLEINPLFADERGVTAIDAFIEVGEVPRHAGRYDHMSIHPYPADLVSQARLKNGSIVLIRPIKPEDAEMEAAFIRGLSAETKYFRFMSALRELSVPLLAKLTQIDYFRELAFIATVEQGDKEVQIGVARYATNPDATSCEFAIVVADAWQRSGVGRALMQVLIGAARSRGLVTMKGVFLASNERMLAFARKSGFVITHDPEDSGLRHGVLDLAKAGSPP